MPTLCIDLQDGFDGDAVVVSVAGKEVYRNPDVRTLTVIGRADSFTAEVPAGPVTLDVEVPSRHLQHQFGLDVDRTTYLGISISGTTVTYRVADVPFGSA